MPPLRSNFPVSVSESIVYLIENYTTNFKAGEVSTNACNLPLLPILRFLSLPVLEFM